MPILSNVKHEKFSQLYLKTGKIRESYVQAGYKDGTSAHVMASKLLRNPKVVARMNELREEISKRLSFSIQDVLEELACIAFLKAEDYIESFSDAGPVFKQWDKIPDRAKRAFAVINTKFHSDGISVAEIKVNNKNDALKQLKEWFEKMENPTDPENAKQKPPPPSTVLSVTPQDLEGKGAKSVADLYQQMLGSKK